MSTSIDVEKRDSLCHIIDIYLSDRQEERYKDRQRDVMDVEKTWDSRRVIDAWDSISLIDRKKDTKIDSAKERMPSVMS